MAQPMLFRLKQRYPHASLDLYAPQWVAAVGRRIAEISEVIVHPFKHGALQLSERIQAARDLRRRAYDQAVVLPNSFKSALLPWLARIPQRTGYVGEMRRGLLNDTRPLLADKYPLMVERYAVLAQAAGEELERPLPMPKLQVDLQSRDAALLRLNLSSQQPTVAFCPGAEYGPAKRWPVAHFAQLARELNAQGIQVWIIGSNKDQALGEAIQSAAGAHCRNLCGQTDLEEAIDLLSCADAVVSNDSGLMHIAAALDKPLIALYGSSSPKFTPPLSARARVVSLQLPCSPCFKRECPLGHFNCMKQLEPARVRAELAVAGVHLEGTPA